MAEAVWALDPERLRAFVDGAWQEQILPAITEYVSIPNKSLAFDAQWREHGHMDRAVDLVAGWCLRHRIPDMSLEVLRDGDRTPLICIEVPGQGEGTVLLYGHLDKQPEMVGWSEGLGPWTPVLRGDRLYGRGSSDDGYAAFAALTALRALHQQQIRHARCVILIEAGEESGSPDLPFYLHKLSDRIGTPDLIICLDSGCGNYDQLWCTTSLRGYTVGTLEVEILREGVHSGDAGGIVPSSFRILRHLLSRLEDAATGAVLVPECNVTIPEQRRQQAAVAADVLGDTVWNTFPFVEGAGPVSRDRVELILNRTWRPALALTGVDGIPSIADGGNVLRPLTAMKLSLRLPPSCDAEAATVAVQKALEIDPPYGAKVRFDARGANGWDSPPLARWLDRAVDHASRTYFGRPAVWMGEGGSIPFMAMLGERFPQAQFMITGVLGPGSNAHGPNEFLHLPTARRLTACVAQVVADHAQK
ncbi:MAG: M20 family metallopeptidase [Candidatus Xenobia bacterium]